MRCLGCLLVLGLLLNLKRFNMYVVVFLSSGIDQKARSTEITNGNRYKLNVIKVNHAVMAIEE